ncbi:MAG: HD domain-containing protein [Chlamydiae bacterium]|nr:HD domain-containing protein [Chlamydiota bacterium]
MSKEYLFFNKKIYDSVHGFIRFDEIERMLIDTFAFQRLHYIRQLGITYMVYPGATHTRFEHSLGVMELSSRIYERICKTLRPDVFHLIPREDSNDYIYWQKILRLAALCHDLGHLPFSHVAEKSLLQEGHEKWTLKVIESPYLEKVFTELNKIPLFHKKEIKNDVIKIALGEEIIKKLNINLKLSSWEKIVSQIITGDFFGADRIDYLLRDSKSTGIVYGLFDYMQLIEMLRILPGFNKEEELQLGIDENGLESCEALLLARHFMHKRVYQYASVKSFNFHLRRFMQTIFSIKLLQELEPFLATNDFNVIAELQLAAKDKSHKGHEDAKKIVFRSDHFKAIALSNKISKEELVAFKKKHCKNENDMDWEFSSFKKQELNVALSRRNRSIIRASESSVLLSSIPATYNNWVYLARAYEPLFLAEFKI